MSEAVIISSGFLTLFYLWFLRLTAKGLKEERYAEKKDRPFVSMIVPFRNEGKNLCASLKSALELDYPEDKLEFIYVDDHSEDNSVDIIKRYNDKRIKLVKAGKPGNGAANKKNAIIAGIRQAKGEIIVTTDADCVYGSGRIKALTSLFSGGVQMVAGPVKLETEKGFFGKMQALEHKGLMTATAGLIGAGFPVSCSGANLAYTKQVYDTYGFDNMHISSGDDDFFMQRLAAHGEKIKFCASYESLVYTKASSSPKEFFEQRSRWAGKGIFYNNPKIVATLALVFLFYLVMISLFIAGFFSSGYFIVSLGMFTAKICAEYWTLKKGLRLIYHEKVPSYYLAVQLFHAPYIVYSSVRGLFGKYNWKGRKVER